LSGLNIYKGNAHGLSLCIGSALPFFVLFIHFNSKLY